MQKEGALEWIESYDYEYKSMDEKQEVERGSYKLIVSRIFADHSTFHLQKDLLDDGNGWLLNRRFIPEHNTVQFEMFRDRNKHMCELVWNVISAECF